jgi:hypothetical protein
MEQSFKVKVEGLTILDKDGQDFIGIPGVYPPKRFTKEQAHTLVHDYIREGQVFAEKEEL